MQYIEMTIEEALYRCSKNTKVLVAVQNLEENDSDIVFAPKYKREYKEMFKDVKTAVSLRDDFIKQLNLFTEVQDIYNIRPFGMKKIVVLKE